MPVVGWKPSCSPRHDAFARHQSATLTSFARVAAHPSRGLALLELLERSTVLSLEGLSAIRVIPIDDGRRRAWAVEEDILGEREQCALVRELARGEELVLERDPPWCH